MKRWKTIFILWAGTGIVPGLASPGQAMSECARRFAESTMPKLASKAETLTDLAERIHMTNQLYIDECAMLLIRDSPQKDEVTYGPIAWAKRAEAMHSRLPDAQWDPIASAWADYLAATGDWLKLYKSKDYCGPVTGLQSIGTDMAYVLLTPVRTIKGPEGTAEGRLLNTPRDAAYGVLSLASDVIVFAPNILMKNTTWLSRMKKNKQLEKLSHTFTTFTDAVATAEKTLHSH